jgi:hypothetical protein
MARLGAGLDCYYGLGPALHSGGPYGAKERPSYTFSHISNKFQVQKYKTWSSLCPKISKLGMVVDNLK